MLLKAGQQLKRKGSTLDSAAIQNAVFKILHSIYKMPLSYNMHKRRINFFKILLRLKIKNQDLSTRYAHCYWCVIAYSSSLQTELGLHERAHTHRDIT